MLDSLNTLGSMYFYNDYRGRTRLVYLKHLFSRAPRDVCQRLLGISFPAQKTVVSSSLLSQRGMTSMYVYQSYVHHQGFQKEFFEHEVRGWDNPLQEE